MATTSRFSPASPLLATALAGAALLVGALPPSPEAGPSFRSVAESPARASAPPSLAPRAAPAGARPSTLEADVVVAPEEPTAPTPRPGRVEDLVLSLDPWVRARAFVELARSDPEQAVLIAAAWLWREDDASMRSLAIRELARLPNEEARIALSEFRQAIDDPSWAELVDRSLSLGGGDRR